MANFKTLDAMLRRQRFTYLKSQFGDHARRHKEVVLVLVTTLPIFPDLLGWPIATIALVNTSLFQADISTVIRDILVLLGLIVGAILWVYTFKDAIGGSRFYDYLRTLPIGRSHLDRLDFVALIITNFPLWILVTMALIIAPYKQMSPEEISLFIARVVLVTFLLIYTQAQFLRQRKSWIPLLIGMVGFINLLGFLPDYWHMVGILATLLILVISFILPCTTASEPNKC